MTHTLVTPKTFQQGGEALLTETATRLAECMTQLNWHKHQPISFAHEILMTRTLASAATTPVWWIVSKQRKNR